MKLTDEQAEALAKVIRDDPGALAAFDQMAACLRDFAAAYDRLPNKTKRGIARYVRREQRRQAREPVV